MWRPPEKIRHPVPEEDGPDRAAVEASRWFRPIRLGPVELCERTWVPAMVPWRAGEDGFVTESLLAWYERFARGRPGALVVEATGIRDIPSGPLLRIGDDRFLPGLSELVETVRRASDGRTRLFIQLIDFLAVKRRPRPETYFQRYLQITDGHRRALGMPGEHDDAVRERLLGATDAQREEILTDRELEALRFGYRERVTDTHLPHIRELPRRLPDLFAAAAGRAARAGFDGVELHYAHAYTMASFLSALNDRDDGYGGPRENRVRLPLEVLAAVRAATPESLAVGCRFLSEDCVPGGSSAKDAAWFGREFARSGMDFLSLSRGGRFEDARQPQVGQAVYPYTGPSGYECMPTVVSDRRGPFGRNVAAASGIRGAIRDAGFETPVVVCGGICTFRQAEEILARGDADIVAAARQTLADPDWFRKIREGRGERVRRCRYTNYCEGLDQMHKEVTCKLWDRHDLDSAELLSRDGRRRLVAPP